ncbi:malate:quinone oxidoreductase [Spelaeicoccus albus]|uniref:malate:quinone oxidoreductase n=1 Tax=Spelaeicoccus albus TaxID=1280376 RepID=UPI0015CA20C9|nr:malate:quinone oxidoreductase [Spelaeicoccus albus]
MAHTSTQADVVLIGGGIMSATLGAILTELQPDWDLHVYERLDSVAQESSDPWNNAGTGHSALCELNYTPEKDDGSIDVSKAETINEQFQVSRQYWSHLVETGKLTRPRSFINPVPHLSYASGKDGVDYLRARYEKLKDLPLFEGIEYTEDRQKLAEWLPLMFSSRDDSEPVAVSRTESGTDVDFGSLTRHLMDYIAGEGAHIHNNHEVTDLKRAGRRWRVTVTDKTTGDTSSVFAKFVFVGAGGGALHLLQKSGIPEGVGYGGFPVSGQFLRTSNPDLVNKHIGKVYGRAGVGAPPMSVPHLDTRVVNGTKYLMFGPYAGFSPKFLKSGKFTDLPFSVRPSNLGVMLAVARDNLDLVKYLVGQLLQSKQDRLDALRDFVPDAKSDDWEMITAGQRVQVMKKDDDRGGKLQFGTEVIAAGDGSVAALLGASPGASTAVPIMLGLLGRCFPEQMPQWEDKIKEMIPTYGQNLGNDRELLQKVRERTAKLLELDR